MPNLEPIWPYSRLVTHKALSTLIRHLYAYGTTRLREANTVSFSRFYHRTNTNADLQCAGDRTGTPLLCRTAPSPTSSSARREHTSAHPPLLVAPGAPVDAGALIGILGRPHQLLI